MNQNDKEIMELKEQIAAKKELLEKSERFTPITHCSLKLDGMTYNVHTLQKPQIIDLLVKVNIHAMSAEDLGLKDEYKINGFTPSDWIKDLKAKLAFVSRKEEEKNLKEMEDMLHNLLTGETKVALEIEKIKSMLK